VKDFFLIAKFSSLWGRDGFVKVELYSDFPEQFDKLDKVSVDFWGDKKLLYIEDVKQSGKSFALKIKNFNSERDASVFIGRELFVEKKDLVKLSGKKYFNHDLIGSKVFQSGTEIGVIEDVLKLPANDVIVIKRDKGKEVLIPLVLEFIERFDPEKKILVLKKEMAHDDED
jgi:16S rRNA processing protein RimM